MATYTKYIDKFNNKNKKDESKSLPADKEAYMAFLEVQLEKVSHALISSKSFDERIESTTNKLGYYDEKFNTMMKLVKLIQAANESQELENAQIKEKLNDLNKKLSKLEFSDNSTQIDSRFERLEKRIDKMQSYLEENLDKIDDQFFMQKNFKEYEKNFSSFEEKINEKLEKMSVLCQNSPKNNIDLEVVGKEVLDKKMSLITQVIEDERKERIQAIEKVAMQGFQKEQIINNLTDDLMSKLEYIEKLHSETNPSAKVKTLEDHMNKEFNEIRGNITNLNEKFEKNCKIMDKTFSFQDPGINKKDFEDFERKITDKIDKLVYEKETIKNPHIFKEISSNTVNNVHYGSDSELDDVLFERSKKLRNEGNTLLKSSIKRSPSPGSSTLKNSSNLLRSRSVSGGGVQSSVKKAKNVRDKLFSNEKRSNSKENNSSKKTGSFKKRSTSKEKSSEKKNMKNQKIEVNNKSMGSSDFYTKNLKYDYSFENSNQASNASFKKQRSLLSDKYKKLEKIYESLSKD